ncbi:hypothetical protein EXE46_01575 [Halorubrum sp. GN11_10-6_MGM]|uniref:hypothetical protein n=1 Tax=Halorubrum sp. GN11_10-6_MGM TaxID=2518112 RepID=UPI0010FA190A|nr:hypothetical protein [Halorubrum sp. GN11_10-6_MGM]TKX75814.1 hypothetical protein EXE46_01575 [Halorubrum sp. GN11_10-6_MGM]
MAGYYDYVLGLIPAVLIGVTAFLTHVGLTLTAALPAGAAAAAAIVAHAMFVRAPVTADAPADASRPGRGEGGPGGRSSA